MLLTLILLLQIGFVNCLFTRCIAVAIFQKILDKYRIMLYNYYTLKETENPRKMRIYLMMEEQQNEQRAVMYGNGLLLLYA